MSLVIKMSKYYLTVANYNQNTKEYENETVVNLVQFDLSTIQMIDFFTATHTRTEIFQLIEKETTKTDWNHLAITYYQNKDSAPYHYRIIEDNPEFATCIKDIHLEEYKILNKYVKTITIDQKNKFYLKEVKKILEIIKNKDIHAFEEQYPYKKDNFYFLVTRYMNSSYDTELEQEKDLKLILKEFSRYIVFRNWVVTQSKKTNHQQLHITPLEFSTEKGKSTKKISLPKSIEENETIFLQEYEKKYKTSYSAYQTFLHNTAYLNEDKEEFLEEAEFQKMNKEEESNSKTKQKAYKKGPQ